MKLPSGIEVEEVTLATEDDPKYLAGQLRLAKHSAQRYRHQWTDACKIIDGLRIEYAKLKARYDALEASHDTK